METQFSHQLTLRVDAPVRFSTLLQSGIHKKIEPGETIGSFLCQLPGFTTHYVSERVQTIFLNGIATDDLHKPLAGGSVLAITTAMPGLAGAIFRKGSPHATLRTIPKTLISKTRHDATVTLKLFGAIARERGEDLLDDGVLIAGKDLGAFLEYRSSLLEQIRSCEFDGKDLPPETLPQRVAALPAVELMVQRAL